MLSSLSVFFPCFNEALNIPILVQDAAEFLPKIAKKYEIIIIDDGSIDNTVQVVKELQKKYPFLRLIRHKTNKGYGAALKTGFKQSKYDWVFFTDGDLQFDIKELEKFLPYTKKFNIIVGYRVSRYEGFIRSLNAFLWRVYMNFLFSINVKDIDCAFKLIKKQVLDKTDLVSDSAFISAELLYKIKKQGYDIMQIPVLHRPRLYGKPTGAKLKVILKALRDSIKAFFKIRILKKRSK